jgi:hypothetical protein
VKEGKPAGIYFLDKFIISGYDHTVAAPAASINTKGRPTPKPAAPLKHFTLEGGSYGVPY